ncbi:MAG: alpha/beta hydrolase [Gemmatimonadota bacterium]
MALKLVVPRIVQRFVYYPHRLEEHEADPGNWGLPRAETVFLMAEDGVRLHAWWLPAPEGTTRHGAAIYLHGNAGHLAHRAGMGLALARTGLDVLMVDYRGYGRSEGSPDEEGLYRDAGAAWRYVTSVRGFAPGRVLLFGESLGGAIAVELASREPVGAIVLVAPLTSTVRVARAHYPLPDILLDWPRHRFDALSRIGRVDAPILIAHGDRDRVVPRAEGRLLFEAAPEPRLWYEARGYGHNDIYDDPGFWRAVDEFVGETLREAG